MPLGILAFVIVLTIVYPHLVPLAVIGIAMYLVFHYTCSSIIRDIGLAGIGRSRRRQSKRSRFIRQILGNVGVVWEMVILGLFTLMVLAASGLSLFGVIIMVPAKNFITIATIANATFCTMALFRLDVRKKRPPTKKDAELFQKLGFTLFACSASIAILWWFVAIFTDGTSPLQAAGDAAPSLIPAAVPLLLLFFTKPMALIAIKIKRTWKRRQQS